MMSANNSKMKRKRKAKCVFDNSEDSNKKEKLKPSFVKKKKISSTADIEKSQCSQSDKQNIKLEDITVEEIASMQQTSKEAIKCDEDPSNMINTEELNLQSDIIYRTKDVCTIKETANTNETNLKDITKSNSLDKIRAKTNTVEACERLGKDSTEILLTSSKAFDVIVNTVVNEEVKNQVGTSDNTNPQEPIEPSLKPSQQTEATSVCRNPLDQIEPSLNPLDQIELNPLDQIEPSLNPLDQIEPSLNPLDQIEPSMNPLDHIEPSLNPLDQIEPSLNPLNQIEPSLNPLDQIEPSLNPLDQIEPSMNPLDQIEPSLNPLDQIEPSLNLLDQIEPSLNSLDQIEPSLNSLDQIEPSLNPLDQIEPSLNPSDQIEQSLNPLDQIEPSLVRQNRIEPTSVCLNVGLNSSEIEHEKIEATPVSLSLNTALQERMENKSLQADTESCSSVIHCKNEAASMSMDTDMGSKLKPNQDKEQKTCSYSLEIDTKSTLDPLKDKDQKTTQCLEIDEKSIPVTQQDEEQKLAKQCLETDSSYSSVPQGEEGKNTASLSSETGSVSSLFQHNNSDRKCRISQKNEQSETKMIGVKQETSSVVAMNTCSTSIAVTEYVSEEQKMSEMNSVLSEKEPGMEGNKTASMESNSSRDIITRSSPVIFQETDLSSSLQRDHEAKSEKQIKYVIVTKEERMEENCQSDNSNKFENVSTNETLTNISQNVQCSTSNSAVKENILKEKCIMQLKGPILQCEPIDLDMMVVQDDSLHSIQVIQSDPNWKADTAVKGVAVTSDLNLKLEGSQTINRDHQNSNKELITETLPSTESVVSSERCLTTMSPVSSSTEVQTEPVIQDDTDLSDSQLCKIDLEQSQNTLKSIATQTKQQEEGRRVVHNLISDMQYLNKLVLKTKREIEAAHRKKQHQLPQMWKTKPCNSAQPTRKF